MTTNDHNSLVPIERIAQAILVLRGQKVLLDADLAAIYGVETKRFNEQVRRNLERFPADFMFQVTQTEWDALRSQFATLKTWPAENGKKWSRKSERLWSYVILQQRRSWHGHLAVRFPA